MFGEFPAPISSTELKGGRLLSKVSENYLPYLLKLDNNYREVERLFNLDFIHQIILNPFSIVIPDSFLFSEAARLLLNRYNWFKMAAKTGNLAVLMRSFQTGNANSFIDFLDHVNGKYDIAERIVGDFHSNRSMTIAKDLDFVADTTKIALWGKPNAMNYKKVVEHSLLIGRGELDSRLNVLPDDKMSSRLKEQLVDFYSRTGDFRHGIEEAISVGEGSDDPKYGLRYMDAVNCAARIVTDDTEFRGNTLSKALSHIAVKRGDRVSDALTFFRMLGDCYTLNFGDAYDLDVDRYSGISDENTAVFIDAYLNKAGSSGSGTKPSCYTARDTVVLPRDEVLLAMGRDEITRILRADEREKYRTAYACWRQKGDEKSAANALRAFKAYCGMISASESVAHHVDRTVRKVVDIRSFIIEESVPSTVSSVVGVVAGAAIGSGLSGGEVAGPLLAGLVGGLVGGGINRGRICLSETGRISKEFQLRSDGRIVFS